MMSESPVKERRRIRNVLLAAAALLLPVGVIIVAPRQVPVNIDLDCDAVQPDSSGYCRSILEPAPGQCNALGSRVDPGGVPGRTLRALVEMEDRNVISSWVALPIASDAGVVVGCYIEVRLTVVRKTVIVDGGPKEMLDGQAPAWRDVVNALDAASIVKPGRVSVRPAYAKTAGGCRQHTYFGAPDPCAASASLDAGYLDDLIDAGP